MNTMANTDDYRRVVKLRAKEYGTSEEVIEKAMSVFWNSKTDREFQNRFPSGCTLSEAICFYIVKERRLENNA